MKTCPQCGKEYPDDVAVCVIDETALVEIKQPEPQAAEADVVKSKASLEKVPYRPFPEYQWSAWDAWKCMGLMVIVWFIVGAIDILIYRYFPLFYRSGHGHALRSLLPLGSMLLPVIYFARTDTWATFLKGFGLDQKPGYYLSYGIAAALMLRFAGHFVRAHGWSLGVTNYDLGSFWRTPGFEGFLFLVAPLVLAPLFEEIVNRGFLYRAFRGSFSIKISMAWIIGWTAFTHWPYYSESWSAAIELSALAIVQCYLREKSTSLWDCIACHLTYNASSLMISARVH